MSIAGASSNPEPAAKPAPPPSLEVVIGIRGIPVIFITGLLPDDLPINLRLVDDGFTLLAGDDEIGTYQGFRPAVRRALQAREEIPLVESPDDTHVPDVITKIAYVMQ